MADSSQPAPAAAPAPEAVSASNGSNAASLIEKLYDRRANVRTMIIATIDDKGRSQVEFSAPMNAPALSHLRTSIDVKLFRYYAAAMFQTSPAGPVAGVQPPGPQAQIPRNVRRIIQKAEKRAQKQRRNSGGG